LRREYAMSPSIGLLDQARHLATLDPRRPKQASLRRAISTAYYALFHLLSAEASQLYAGDFALTCCIGRSISHGDMYEIPKEFANGDWPKLFNSVKSRYSVPQHLKDVAQAFVELQEARHNADYELGKTYARSDAVTVVARAQRAFQDWNSIRKEDLARIYLACFLNWKQWNKGRT
jgi:hypothetical protein